MIPGNSYVGKERTQFETDTKALRATKRPSNIELRDGSRIVKFKKIWVGENSKQGQDYPKNRFFLYEVETSAG